MNALRGNGWDALNTLINNIFFIHFNKENKIKLYTFIQKTTHNHNKFVHASQ